MRQWTLLLCAVLVLVGASQAMAGRCYGVPEEDIVWCDDFDSYCVGGDAWPGYPSGSPPTCPTDGTAVKDSGAFYGNWPSECSTLSGITDSSGKQTNLPFSVIYYGNGAAAQMHTWNFSSVIEARNPASNAVNGTDAVPLIVWFYTRYQTGGAEDNSPQYVELSLGGDHAPTDYVVVDCSPEAQGPYPVICQQNRAWEPEVSTICPALDTTTVHSAFAYGMLAQLDPNPCNEDGTGRRPSRDHPVVFDGVKWTEIRANRFTPGVGDFSNVYTNNMWKMQIKSNQVIVELENSNCAPGFCWATVPRLYTGPFDTISMGTGPGCELNPITGGCVGETKCFDYPADNDPWNGDTGEAWANSFIDSPAIWDGVLTSTSGACCLPDLSCQDDKSLSECLALSGVSQGSGTECATTLCCHDPFADGDGDTDVDQADFGLWQACYDGGAGLIAGCECYDRVSPVGVDNADFTAFTNCFSGANVPADPGCDD